MDPSLNLKFIYVSYTSYTCSLKVILCSLVGLHFDCNQSHEDVCRILYLWHCIGTQKVSDSGAYRTLDFEIGDIQPVVRVDGDGGSCYINDPHRKTQSKR